MEKDYIKTYQETYASVEVSTEKEIKEKYIDFKNRGRSANKAGNTIIRDFEGEKTNNKYFKVPFDKLFYLYKNRLSEFDVEYQMNVILEILLPEFSKLNRYQNLTFEKYIKELAKLNARIEMHRLFSMNRNFYELLFKLNDFKEFKLKYCNCGDHSLKYEQFRLRLHPNSLSIDSGVTSNTSILDDVKETKPEKKIINFKIEDKSLLSNDNYYNDLTYYFIDDKKTSFNDFKNVLLKDFDSHTSEIHFFCSNYLARQLILSFKIKLKGKINLNNAAKSKKFKSSNGNTFSQSNLSSSTKCSSEVDEKILQLLN